MACTHKKIKIGERCKSPNEDCNIRVWEFVEEFGESSFLRKWDRCDDCQKEGIVKKVEGNFAPDQPQQSILAKAVGYKWVVGTMDWGGKRRVTAVSFLGGELIYSNDSGKYSLEWA